MRTICASRVSACRRLPATGVGDFLREHVVVAADGQYVHPQSPPRRGWTTRPARQRPPRCPPAAAPGDGTGRAADPAHRTGSGLTTVEGGLRLRYEVTRRFAPYVGVDHVRRRPAPCRTTDKRSRKPTDTLRRRD
ncbi:copper resistance protein B [Pantoea ananatis]|uniref:copper resistance protein B n=1 Tax=Pantoea ananas TaxID=553 RepID=UPI0022200F1D|nr:copper resistance protein B [Pantoea ananatis]